MFKEFIRKVTQRENLTTEEAREAMRMIMEGECTAVELAGYLVGLRMKGETVEEITGSAQAMREKALAVRPQTTNLVDTCGTGGDGRGTFNISTTTALVVAGAGVPVAKHGNRAVSGSSGSADVLEALGVNLELTPDEMARCIDEVGLGFLYAPRLHPAMRRAAGPRRELGIRTIFNLLGPLTNPAQAPAQLIGVYDPELTEKIGAALINLGVQRAMVVHGADGLDEVSLSGQTKVTEVERGRLRTYYLEPGDFGLSYVPLREIQGRDPQTNAHLSREVLSGKKDGRREVVLANAALALMAAGLAENPRQGVILAAQSIDQGRAAGKLEELAAFTAKLAAARPENTTPDLTGAGKAMGGKSFVP